MKVNLYNQESNGVKMYKSIIFLVLISLQTGFSQNKMKFDIVEKKQQDGLSKISNDVRQESINNEWIGMTLISGGYFTIGTNKGLSDKKLDDNCQITFGHPLAKTSYALFGIDGNWNKLDDYYPDPAFTLPVKNGNELKIVTSDSHLFNQEFSMQVCLLIDQKLF